MTHRLPVILACMHAAVAFAAVNPEYDADYRRSTKVFDTGGVAVVRVTMSPADLSDMLTDVWSDEYRECLVVFTNRFIRETVTNVGIRLRGNTSRTAVKKSYKLSFNKFVSGRKFHGLRKLNLNGEHNDPSIMRSALCWPLFENVRIPGSRTSHALLYINGDLFGLFANVEEIDDEFLDSRFGSDNGNLFKCLYKGAPADLDYRADGRYDLVGGGTTYQLRTNEESNDFTDLAHFIDVLNNTPVSSLPDAFGPVFDIESFIRWMAVSALCGSWDDYRYLANNYYLYDNPADGKFAFIPYDYDNTLGVDWIERDWATRDLNDWDRHGTGNPRPLSINILSIPRYRRLYNQYLADVAATWFAPTAMTANATALKANIQEAAELNYAHVPHDYGFDISDFNTSLTNPATYSPKQSGDHLTYGVLSYVSTRVANVSAQLDDSIIALNEVVVSNVAGIVDEGARHVPWLELYNPSWNNTSLTGLYLTDDAAQPHTWALPDTNICARGFLLLWLDGHPERGALHSPFIVSESNTLYLVHGSNIIDLLEFPALSVDESYGRYIDWASFERGFASPTPGAENVLLPLPAPSVLINEFQADNGSTITNPVDGNFDDWIELVNAGDSEAQLQGIFLSDDSSEPTKWHVSEPVKLLPGEYLLIWADGHPEYGNCHAGFKLSKDGEELIAVASDGTTVIDYIEFGTQTVDTSYGRFPDAYGGPSNAAFFVYMSPTPGAANVPEPFLGVFVVLAVGLLRWRGQGLTFNNYPGW